MPWLFNIISYSSHESELNQPIVCTARYSTLTTLADMCRSCQYSWPITLSVLLAGAIRLTQPNFKLHLLNFTITKRQFCYYTIYIEIWLVCLFVCLFASNKRQNGWTDQAQIFCGTSRDPREGLWMIKGIEYLAQTQIF